MGTNEWLYVLIAINLLFLLFAALGRFRHVPIGLMGPAVILSVYTVISAASRLGG